MTAPPDLYIGLMSGTSLDGVDAALITTQPEPALLASLWLPYPEALARRILDLHEPGGDELDRAARLGNELADLYAETVTRLLATQGIDPRRIRAIGCHGQTVRHRPALGYTLQLGNAARLAERTGIRVVADFRSRDIAAGGQGAPLVPAFHAALFRSPDAHRVIMNVGGIANLTDLPPSGTIRGFDCGPGNMLMDAWAQRHWGLAYDRDGAIAGTGTGIEALRERLLAHPFLAAAPPKSAGREEFNLAWLEGLLSGRERPEDVMRTLLEFTVEAMAAAVRAHCPGTAEVYLCGGGAHNGTLRSLLAQRLPAVRIGLTGELGVPADWVEAYAFAWLAHRTLRGEPGNLPEVTGAQGPRVLGAIYPA